MRIRLEVYFDFRGQRIYKADEQVPDGITPAQLLAHLGIDKPDLAVLVDGRFHPDGEPIAPGAEVAVLRRSEGGA